jgi:hypothetical protein
MPLVVIWTAFLILAAFCLRSAWEEYGDRMWHLTPIYCSLALVCVVFASVATIYL